MKYDFKYVNKSKLLTILTYFVMENFVLVIKNLLKISIIHFYKTVINTFNIMQLEIKTIK